MKKGGTSAPPLTAGQFHGESRDRFYLHLARFVGNPNNIKGTPSIMSTKSSLNSAVPTVTVFDPNSMGRGTPLK
jgi:hypothetical protein